MLTSTRVAALATAALSLTLLIVPATAGEAPGEPPRVAQAAPPVITWGPCASHDEPAECATVPVPLDHDEPAGDTVDLDLLRMPATDPANRIGSLFVNPGGPGGSSTGFAAFFGQLVPDVVSERFDIVGIDPRGVGRSARMKCTLEGQPAAFPRAAFPTNERQVRAQITFDKWQRKACRQNPAPIVGNMSTADTARDMDLIREALGEIELTYYGISYGTQLGSTYAAMFPDNVRAMILDGVLDPIDWTTGRGNATTHPFSERLGSGYGAWQGLTNALAECDRVGRDRCPISGRAPEVWADIIQRLERGPFNAEGVRITYSDVVAGTLGTLYDPRGIRFLMRELRSLHRLMFGRGGDSARLRVWNDPATMRRRVSDKLPVVGPYGAGYGTGYGSGSGGGYGNESAAAYGRVRNPFAGVACADSDNPDDERTWVGAGNRADRRSPWFGAAWTWASSICADWPASTKEDRFAGPFEATPSSPVLVVGNTYDPATPLHGARSVNRLLEGSRLVVMDGWGHGAIATGPCIDQVYADYLVDQTLPPSGTVCTPRKPLFPR